MSIKNTLVGALITSAFLSTATQAFSISSSAFVDGDDLPKQYSCNGADISPPLTIKDAPEGTKSFVLVMDDPDAPNGTWLHWVLYNVPASVTEIPEKASTKPIWEDGTMQGKNDWSDAKYGGACPPDGKHRYFFKLYALDIVLELKKKANLFKVKKAMKKHILAEAKMMAKYG